MELALVAPLFITLLLGTIQVGVLELLATNLDVAVMRTARLIRTGSASRPTSAGAFKAAICSAMIDKPEDCQSRLAISVQKVTDFGAAGALADAAPGGQFDTGGPGEIILVRASYRWPLILPMYAGGFKLAEPTVALLDARAAFRNEPYA